MEVSISKSGSASRSDTPSGPDTAKSKKKSLQPAWPTDKQIVASRIERAQDIWVNLNQSSPDLAARAHQTLATWDQKIETLCDTLGLPPETPQDTARADFKQAVKTSFSWMEPEHLPEPEKEALKELELTWKDAVKSAPGEIGKKAQFLNNLLFGFAAGAGGFAMISLISKTAMALVGRTGMHAINIGGPLILLLTEVLAGRLRARGARYDGVDTGAYLMHDRLEREYQANATEIWYVKKKKSIGPEADAPRWQHQVETLERKGSQLRVGQQRIFVDLLHRELGHEIGTKKPTDAPDAPRMRPLCCFSKVEHVQNISADGPVTHEILYDGKPLFTIDDPASFAKFPAQAMVTWANGERTDLNRERVPDEYEGAFATATFSLTAGATVRGLVCDEAMFAPLIIALMIAGPAGLHFTHTDLTAGVWKDLAVAWTLEVLGMMTTAQLQNIARSYWSGANVVSARDEQIQAKLHTLCSAKEDSLEMRLELVDDLQKLADDELDATLEKLRPIRTDMHRRMRELRQELDIDSKQLLAYGKAVARARTSGVQPNLEDFPDVVKLKSAAKEDPELQRLSAQDRKDSLSEKRQQLNRLQVALRRQRAAVEKARGNAAHDMRAASSDAVRSYGTSVADAYKDLGKNPLSTSAKLVSYGFGFTGFTYIFLRYANVLLAQDAPPHLNATDPVWSNSTTMPGHSGSGLTNAEILMAFQGFWFFATVGQRHKALLWPVQKLFYGVSGHVRGLTTLIFGSPPPVVTMMPEGDDADMVSDDQILLPEDSDQDTDSSSSDSAQDAVVRIPNLDTDRSSADYGATGVDPSGSIFDMVDSYAESLHE